MSFTQAKNLPGLLLFIDFEKAFDSLEWHFLEKCLELFNFGPDLIRWVNTFYKNVKSCIINNGQCSHYFNVERRQGDPLSPYLFVICVEILAIAVRNDENIKGIKISDSETKLLQLVDDTTAILGDLNSAQALLKLLNDFEKVSGLKPGADLGGGCRECAPLPPEMTCGCLIQLVFTPGHQSITPFLSGATPPKKNPGSAPEN